MSVINAITRTIQGYPRDHVAILKDGYIYESTFKIGVQKISFDAWRSDRSGTDLIEYEISPSLLDFSLFTQLDPVKYDNRAAIFHLFGLEDKLKKRANKAVNCSELVALMLGLKDAWKALPIDVENHLRGLNLKSNSTTL